MKKHTSYANFFAVNSERIKQRHASVHDAAKDRQSREGYKKWRSACDEFRAQYDSLAFPGGYSSGLDRLKINDPEAIDAALAFIELRPYFFRSQYIRTRLLRALKKIQLTEEQALRLKIASAAPRRSDTGPSP